MRFGASLLTFLALLRIAYILSANPIGEFTQELVYLRVRELRQPGFFLFVVILLEMVQFILPFLERQGLLRPLVDVPTLIDVAQSLLVLSAAVMVVFVVARYTHRALDRRIRESMETLAYLEGQRRRRRSLERGDWNARDEE